MPVSPGTFDFAPFVPTSSRRPADVALKLGSKRVLAEHDFRAGGMAPSEILRRHEADLIAEMARMAHMDGRRFDGWPTLRLEERHHWGPTWLLTADVQAVKP